MNQRSEKRTGAVVAPFAGAWIEILIYYPFIGNVNVAPFAGAWIEIRETLTLRGFRASLPSRERGLKSELPQSICIVFYVAPFAGAWIEILIYYPFIGNVNVAPFAGAWIEIIPSHSNTVSGSSRSLRGSVD